MDKRVTLIALAVFLIVGTAQAMPIVDYFDYGAAQVDLASLGAAGGGWGGSWTSTGSSNCSDYIPAANLTYGDGNYLAPDNIGGGVGNGANTTLAGRTLAIPFADTTVWLSAIVNTTGGDILLTVDGVGTSNFIAVRSGVAKLRYNGADSGTTAVSNGMHLMLARIVVNSSGNDSIDYWIDPTLSAGELGLGTTVSSKNTADPYGPSLTGIGLYVAGTNRLDALRIGTTLAEVTTPEPATLMLLALGGLLGVRRRA